MTPVNPPEVVVWAFASSAKEIARRTTERNKRLGRNLIGPPQQIRSLKTRDQAEWHDTPIRQVTHGRKNRSKKSLGVPAPSVVGAVRPASAIVESRTSAGADGKAPSRFPSPLIKPDVPISSIRLSDRLHRRLTQSAGAGQAESLVARRRPARRQSVRCRATAPYGGASGNAVHARRRNG
jgi:hypothetical protein